MANMSYCRFQNTLNDLRDCEEHITDKLSGEEFRARNRLIKICENIIDEVGGREFVEDKDEDD
jgi:hypothetical protein